MVYNIVYELSKGDYCLIIKKYSNNKNIKVTYELSNEEEHVSSLIYNMISNSITKISINNIITTYDNIYIFTVHITDSLKYEYGFVSSDMMDDIDNMVVYSEEKDAEKYLNLAKSACLVMNMVFEIK